MRDAYARCMDGHYYLLTGNPHRPLDGWTAPAAERVLPALSQVAGRLSLGALAAADVPDDLLSAIQVAEIPDADPAPRLLRPWYDGDAEAR